MCQINAIIEDGKVVGYARTCGHKLPSGELESPDDRMVRLMAAMQDDEPESVKLFDPNRRFGRKVDQNGKTINLGMRVNKLAARTC